MNKKFLFIISLIITIGLAVFLLHAREALFKIKFKKELPEIKVAITISYPSLFIATEKRFFEEEEIMVKFETMSAEDGLSALLAEKVDYVIQPAPFLESYIRAALEKEPIKIIMFPSRYRVLKLIAQPGLKLENLKNMAIHPSMNYPALKFIEENNLEIEIITITKFDELEILLTLGKVEAALFRPSPHSIRLLAQNFLLLNTIFEPLPSGLITRDEKIKNEPNEAKKMIRALERAAEFIITEPEETKEFLINFSALEGVEKTEENIRLIKDLIYPIVKTAFDRREVATDEEAELLIQIIKAGNFNTIREVKKQTVTTEEIERVFDFRLIK